jgi:hypothetical protein
MTDATMVRTPTLKAVALEQLRVVGLALRREGLVLCAGLLLFMLGLPFFDEVAPPARPFALEPEILGYLAALVAVLTPLGVWKGERRFGESPLWTMPVEHARHARLKIASGWIWLMGVVAFGYLTIVSAVVLAGGSLGLDETRLLVVDLDAARVGAPGSLTEARWSTQLWQWTLPFTVATTVYLAASAFLVGLRRPVVWGACCWLAFLAFGALSATGRLAWLTSSVETVVHLFDLLASGGSESAQVMVLTESGERVRAWTRLPTLGGWVAATSMWTGLAGVAVWAATRRHREG